LDTVLYHLAESLRLTAEALRPFLPSTAERMAEQLGISLGTESWAAALGWGWLAPDTEAAKAQPIFPKLEIAEPAE
jgi:methionyl-tRNA synthetase